MDVSQSGGVEEQVEQLRRSVAMLPPGAMALGREDALAVLTSLRELRRRLTRLERGLRELLEEP